MTAPLPQPLPAEALARRCDPDAFSFVTTADLDPLPEALGQERALEAARFAMGVKRAGYNLLAVGPPGVGKHRILNDLLERLASSRPPAGDLCYVYDFERPHEPRALSLPSGRGRVFAQDMKRLVDDLKAALPAAFESEEFRGRVQQIQEELTERAEKGFLEVEAEARENNIKMLRAPSGVAFFPTAEGQVLSPQAFKVLPSEERDRVTAKIEALQTKLSEHLRNVPRWAKQARQRVRELKREASRFAVGHSIDDLEERYQDLPEVLSYLAAVAEDVVAQSDAFEDGDDGRNPLEPFASEDPFRRYEVNLLVDNGDAHGAPVVYEDNPTVEQLLGHVAHRVRFGNLISDFTLIRAGSLHRAHGGFLLVDARKLLAQPHAFEALKRALFSKSVRIDSLAKLIGLASSSGIEPQPAPLDVKVILVIDRHLYMMLRLLDSETAELFKVTADFEDRIARDDERELSFARMLADIANRQETRPLDRAAVARIIEESARQEGDAHKLSTGRRLLEELVIEADHYAAERGADRLEAVDVEDALAARKRRNERVEQRVHEAIVEGTLLVATDGEQIGQINGLWVRRMGDYDFGAPARITATVRVGKGEVVDIERETELGGPIHSKGVMILSSYFASRFARTFPLSLRASLVFEQSYAGVDGDSASLAELCALLSALSELPIRQSFAVTGSVNQLGAVQPIGGVNEKIEGFFDVCTRRGLGGQAVIVPAANRRHLMLRSDVVAACREGRFHVYAVERVEEAIELLTGVAAGAADTDESFPPDSVHGRVHQRLRDFALVGARFAKLGEGADAPAASHNDDDRGGGREGRTNDAGRDGGGADG